MASFVSLKAITFRVDKLARAAAGMRSKSLDDLKLEAPGAAVQGPPSMGSIDRSELRIRGRGVHTGTGWVFNTFFVRVRRAACQSISHWQHSHRGVL